MQYKVDVMTSSKREAAGIGDGASKLKLRQQKQLNTGCQQSSDGPQCNQDEMRLCYCSSIWLGDNTTIPFLVGLGYILA